ncbi:MAG: FprA family A-type flavoprotein [Bacteroidia bacterium]|nr:FprA family A-type flavoprotein [Bacteroidia bacterium]
MKNTDDRIIDITGDVKWIGILDYDIRTFDIVMTTDFGTTYNSYFINAEKKALIEVAKGRFFDTYLKKLKEVTNPSEISYIILDHTEPDHSGSLKQLLEIAPSATVVGSGNAIRYLEDMLNIPFRSMTVKDGDVLDLGNKKLRFISAPNLHWPDSIYTWLEQDRILFTCDSFGAHFCSYEMKDDLTDDYLKAFRYYFDVILKPYSRFMIKAIERIKPLDTRYICPGHGPVLGANRNTIIDLSLEYANEYLDLTQVKARRHILIAYVSAYGYTKMAAEIIAEGIKEVSDFTMDLVDIEHIDLGALDAYMTVSDALLAGSPTINQNTLLPVYKLFAIINPLRDKGKLAGTFGSYGWSGEAPKIMLETFRNLKLKIFEESAAFKFLPGGDKEKELKEYGRKFARMFEEECAQK